MYLIVVLFFIFWPSDTTTTAESMNYAILTTGTVVGISVVYYFVWGRKDYNGPVVEIDI